jgi:carbonic anhydrase
MRLFEAVLEANHRAVAGDAKAGLQPADFADALPVAALTCIDARLNRLLPGVLGIPEESFIWLRNAGNIITGPLSSTMRSLALACAVKGAREIAIIGHTDCLVCKTGAMQLLNRFAELGVERGALPDNLTEYFGLFASERQNIIKAADVIRHSPLIGAKVPVHGLLVEIQTGRVEWVVNGYESLYVSVAGRFTDALKRANQALDAFEEIGKSAVGEIKFPETKIGEALHTAQEWLKEVEVVATPPPISAAPAQPPVLASAQPPLARPILAKPNLARPGKPPKPR